MNPRRRLQAFLVAATAVVICAAAAPKAWADTAPVFAPPPVVRFLLPNGLDVVLQENHRQPQVAVIVAYDSGSVDDPADYREMAHLVEHLTYGGSRHLQANEGWDVLRRAGASEQQGTTAPDWTSFDVVVPRQSLETALWVESERMAFTLEHFDHATLERELKVVASEWRLRTGINFWHTDHMLRGMFGSFDLASAQNPMPDLNMDHFTLTDVQWFFQQVYRPDNAHVIIVGDFDTASVRRLVEKYFGSIAVPPTKLVPRATRNPQFTHHAITWEISGISLQRFTLAWPAPPQHTRTNVALDVFFDAYAKRLRHRLVVRDALALRVQRGGHRQHAGSAELITIDLKSDASEQDVEKAILDEWKWTWKRDWTVEFQTAARRAFLGLLHLLESPLSQARIHRAFLTSEGVPFDWAGVLAQYRSMSAADLKLVEDHLDTHPWLVGKVIHVKPRPGLPKNGRMGWQ